MKEEFNIKEYIDSGILVEYALGLCTTNQNMEIFEKLQLYPELQNELIKIENSLEAFARHYSKPVPDYLKERIMWNIEQEKTFDNSKRGIGKNYFSYLFYVSAILFLLTSFYFWNQQVKSKQELSELNRDFQALYERYLTDSLYLIDCRDQLNELLSNNQHRILLKGTPKSPQSFAAIYYDTLGQRTVLDVMDLPPAPPQKQYQLWAIVSGTPIDLGVFDLTTHNSVFKKIKFVPHAQAFAITLEPHGGQSAPSLDQMYVLGTL